MKVLAAMSGGVDSAVAAARAAEAGHDVTGIHLALSRNPKSYRTGARGCCTIEDSNDARRAADVIGIPFYVWDLSDRFHEDVVEDFMAEYAAGRTPNPCLRCNEKIKFAAVLDRALALGFDAVATGHYAQLRTGDDGLIEMHRARHGKDQSYVLGVLDPGAARARDVPARRLHQGGVRAEAARRGWPSPTSPTATTSASSPTATTPAGCARSSAPGSRRQDRRRGRAVLGTPRGGVRLHDRPAQGPADRHARRRRQAALRARHRAGVRHRDGRPARASWPSTGSPASSRAGAARSRRAAARHGPAACPRRGDRAVVRVEGDASRSSCSTRRGHRPGQAAVVYDGTRVVGSATIAATRAPRAGTAVSACHRRRVAARRGHRRGRRGSCSGSCPTCRTCPSCPGRGAHGRDDRPRARGGRRARRRPPAGRLAAHRRAPASTTARAIACSRRTSTRSRSGPRATTGRSRCRWPGRGRWPRRSSGRAATGCSPTTAPAGSSPRRWPRALREHLADVRRRRPRRRALVVQVDEPALPAVLAGRCRRRPASTGTGPSTRRARPRR